MRRAKPTRVLLEAQSRTAIAAIELGQRIRAARRRRRLTQASLGDRIGLKQARIGAIERGQGGTARLETWFALAAALRLPLRVELGRDPDAEPADAGHLRIQELLLRLGRACGRTRSFELPTRPADPSRSVDVCLRDDRQRCMLILEAWNTIGDIGAAARSSSRKAAEAEALAVAIGGDEGPYRVAACWVIRATATNQSLLRRYPEAFAVRFPASSRAWVAALARGAEPPSAPGIVWCDVNGTRLFACRRRAADGA